MALDDLIRAEPARAPEYRPATEVARNLERLPRARRNGGTRAPLRKGAPAFRRESRVLNVGCGPRADIELHQAFRGPAWREIRVDIQAPPDTGIPASLDVLSRAAGSSFDAVWSSHAIEHLYAHEVPHVLRDMARVLRPEGFALVTCPDLAAIAELIGRGGLRKTAYMSPAGPITPLDMLFGHSASIAGGRFSMAHRTGFTAERLMRLLAASGFSEIRIGHGQHYDLWALALLPGTKRGFVQTCLEATPEAYLLGSGKRHLPDRNPGYPSACLDLAG